MKNIAAQVTDLAERIHLLRADRPRVMVALVGAPGAGKSTLAAELSRRLTDQRCPNVVVPMDGFHLDNAVLADRGLEQVKGAPETFDVFGFIRLVKALKEAREEVVVPVFDRPRDIAIAGAVAVPANWPVVIVEGNYLMFDEDPWRALAPIWDLSARIDLPMPDLRARLIQRWLSLNHSRAVATRRAESNDIPNAQRVIDRALACDVTFRND